VILPWEKLLLFELFAIKLLLMSQNKKLSDSSSSCAIIAQARAFVEAVHLNIA
jgi:hypothetical protein